MPATIEGDGEARRPGWIADTQGIACVSGERKTTAIIGEGGDITRGLTDDTGTTPPGKIWLARLRQLAPFCRPFGRMFAVPPSPSA